MSISVKASSLFIFSALLFLSACQQEAITNEPDQQVAGADPVFLVIDEESIDNGNEPNNFSAVDVNDPLATVGQRKPLDYFQKNIGKVITLYTGQVGDEGWHAIKTIPSSWIATGPGMTGARNFLQAGPGLGSGSQDDNKEVLLDKIPGITPLRATGLTMLKGQTILAVVYDSEISINYSPLEGNLMGANLGIVAFEVLEVTERTDGSTSSLPRVSVRIKDATEVASNKLLLFSNAPVPRSSSEPYDIKPPVVAPAIELTTAL